MKTQTTMTMAAMVVCAAMGWGCSEPDPRGELTDTLCFDGLWNPYSYYDPASDVVSLALVANGQATMKIGRVREGEEPLLTFSGQNNGWCDFDEAPAIDRVVFQPGLDASIDHEVDGNTITLTTGRGGLGTMRVETAVGELEVELAIREADTRELTSQAIDRSGYDYGYDYGEERVLRVAAGSTVALDLNARSSRGGRLRGVTDWSPQELWTFEDSVTVHDPFVYLGREAWVEFHGMKVTDEVGSYEVRNGEQSLRVEVVSPDEIFSMEVCEYDTCVHHAEAFPFITPSESYSRDGWDIELEVVFRNAEGEVIEGVPDDFAIELPDGWRDLNEDLSAIGSPYRKISIPDGRGSDEVVVRANGRFIVVGVHVDRQ